MHLFQKKIDNPLHISLDLERLGRNPDASGHNFTTCDPVAFYVTLALKQPEEIGCLIVRFYGTSLADLDIAGANGTTGGSSQPWLFFHDLSRDIKKTLQPGIHKWCLTSQFPEFTDASLIEGDEAFDEECKLPPCLFQNGAHPLPPTCRIRTDHRGIDTHTRVWYAIDAEFTRPTGHQSEPGKLMKPVSIDLTDKPLSPHYIPSVPKLVKEKSKSKALVDGQEWDGERAVDYTPGEPALWTEREDSPPNFSTYNVCAQQTINVKVKATFAGLDFELEYQEDVKKDMQWWRKKDVVELRGNCWWREHNLIEDLEKVKKERGKIVWDVPEVKEYVFQKW